MKEDVELKKHNTCSNKYEGSAPMGKYYMADSALMKNNITNLNQQ